jgi:hypothetical protein
VTSFEVSEDNILQALWRPLKPVLRAPLSHTITKDLGFLQEHEEDVRQNRIPNGFIELDHFLNVPASVVIVSRIAANLSRLSICLIQARWVDTNTSRSKASVGS